MIFNLDNIAEFQKGFAFKSKDFKESGVKIVKVSNLTDESIHANSCICIDNQLALNYKQYELNKNDIIITTVGSWPTNPASVVGKVVRVPTEMKGSLLNQNAVRVRSNERTNQKYLYYLLKINDFKEYIIGTAQGSANQASITQKDIKNFKYDIHELVEQKVIANILSTIDEKIENNNQINENLQSLSQLLFKQWFVDFNFPNEEDLPYKSSGGEMVDSEIGLIPENWKVILLNEIFSFTKGKKPKEIYEQYFQGSKIYLTIDVLNRRSILYTSGDKVVLAKKKDILMVMDGASSGTLYYGMDGIVGSTLSKIEPKNKGLTNDIIFYLLKLYENDIRSNLTGSAIPHTDKGYINNLKFAIPNDKNITIKISEILSDFRDKKIINDEESFNLANLRDTLLPKLMNGEINL